MEAVPVERIDFARDGWDLYLLRYRVESAAIVQSVAERGVIEPVTLERRGGLLRVIAGFRRVAAAKAAKIERIAAVVYDEGEIAPNEAFRMALASNAPGLSYSDADRALALRRASERFGFSEDALIDEVAPQLGLAPSHKVVRTYMEIALMPRAIGDALADGVISRQHCEALALLPAAERRWFFETVAAPLRLSAGDTRLIAEAAIDLAGRSGVSVRMALEPSLARSGAPEIPGKAKAALKDDLVRRLRPIMTEMEAEFAALSDELPKTAASFDHTPNFEADEVRLHLAASSVKEIRALAEALETGLEKRVFERMLSIARRKAESIDRQYGNEGTCETNPD